MLADAVLQVAVKTLSPSASHCVLGVPEYFSQFGGCSVVCMGISPSGLAVASAVRVEAGKGGTAAHCLLVWARDSLGSSAQWTLAGMADLGVAERSADAPLPGHSKVLLQWAALEADAGEAGEETLVVAAATFDGPRPAAPDAVRLLVIHLSEVRSGVLKEAVRRGSCVQCPCGSGLSALRVLPAGQGRVVRPSGTGHVGVLLASRCKLLYISVPPIPDTDGTSERAEVLWSDVSISHLAVGVFKILDKYSCRTSATEGHFSR